MEVDALEDGVNVHILAYGVDLTDSAFLSFLHENAARLEGQDDQLIRVMEGRVPSVSWADYAAFTYDRRLGGWKALHYLMAKGLTASLKKAWPSTQYGVTHAQFDYPPVERVPPHRAAGGRAVLARRETIREDDMGLFIQSSPASSPGRGRRRVLLPHPFGGSDPGLPPGM